jgi:hypothetical protein
MPPRIHALSEGVAGEPSLTVTPRKLLEREMFGLLLIVGLAIIVGLFLRTKDKGDSEIQEAMLAERRPVIVKKYMGNQSDSYAAFQKDAVAMAARNYFPTSQNWAPGQWGRELLLLHFCSALFSSALSFLFTC